MLYNEILIPVDLKALFSSALQSEVTDLTQNLSFWRKG